MTGGQRAPRACDGNATQVLSLLLDRSVWRGTAHAMGTPSINCQALAPARENGLVGRKRRRHGRHDPWPGVGHLPAGCVEGLREVGGDHRDREFARWQVANGGAAARKEFVASDPRPQQDDSQAERKARGVLTAYAAPPVRRGMAETDEVRPHLQVVGLRRKQFTGPNRRDGCGQIRDIGCLQRARRRGPGRAPIRRVFVERRARRNSQCRPALGAVGVQDRLGNRGGV